MNKIEKGILLGIACYFSALIGTMFFGVIIEDEDTLSIIVLIFLILPLLIYFFVIKKYIKREEEYVKEISPKIKEITLINNKYVFREITNNKHFIREREYSRRSLDRVTGYSIIMYNIENNVNYLRTDIENALYNINLLWDYKKDIEDVLKKEFVNESNYTDKKYKRVEDKILRKIIYTKNDFLITLKVEAYYESNKGNTYIKKNGNYNFEELVSYYNEWLNGGKYKESIKREREIMNSEIRYNVLKRDNYTCKICGATSRDGVKLHVDHIIPVSRGGKTVMSNLQTLCDRCNRGKSNKMDIDYENDMICPRCGHKLEIRKGKYGSFIGCGNYPRCKYIRK